MLSVQDALARVLEHAQPRAPSSCPVPEALGLLLAEDITSDIDSPPHDKSLVDGYAVIAADLSDGTAELEILEEITAGNVPTREIRRGSCARIMTGAPIPRGAEAVVMIERSEHVSGPGLGRARLNGVRPTLGSNIMRRAASMARGQTILRSGAVVRSIEIGLLSEVGRVEVRAIARPRVAVLATGNELVRAVETPTAGQIRNSNGPLLAAAARMAGSESIDLGIARDDRGSLRELISQGLARDILVISGGVSAGVLDLVPSVLAELAVEQIFHKINLKPGKPLWFGVWEAGRRPEAGAGSLERSATLTGEGSRSTTQSIPPTSSLQPPASSLVFGLPGNPVSSFVCFELFVRPAIARLAGRQDYRPETVTARLATEFAHRSDRETYHPARLLTTDEGYVVEPLLSQGSGDLRTLADANALAVFEPGQRRYAAGESLPVVRLPRF
jgi:molybdopterin molybdotransferase